MTYHLRVYDNFHYNDESEAYNTGHYDSYENALTAAKTIVDEFLVFNWKKGMTPIELRVLFLLYGDDPIVVPDEMTSGDIPRFSARKYVDEVIFDLRKRLEKQ
jgi:hypothetical protein